MAPVRDADNSSASNDSKLRSTGPEFTPMNFFLPQYNDAKITNKNRKTGIIVAGGLSRGNVIHDGDQYRNMTSADMEPVRTTNRSAAPGVTYRRMAPDSAAHGSIIPHTNTLPGDSTNDSLIDGRILVFSKCFRAGFGAFSTFKFKVIEGTN